MIRAYARFQSTLPVWGATFCLLEAAKAPSISIHAPRVGSDSIVWVQNEMEAAFQSTLPVWGATSLTEILPFLRVISIHAPRVGSDLVHVGLLLFCDYFNPRSPCGERHFERFQERDEQIFQSTLPVWGATRQSHHSPSRQTISIHAPRVGSDFAVLWNTSAVQISIHAPRVGSDSLGPGNCQERFYFNPRSPCGERRQGCGAVHQGQYFNPRSPCGERLTLTANLMFPDDFNPRSPCGERPAHF